MPWKLWGQAISVALYYLPWKDSVCLIKGALVSWASFCAVPGGELFMLQAKNSPSTCWWIPLTYSRPCLHWSPFSVLHHHFSLFSWLFSFIDKTCLPWKPFPVTTHVHDTILPPSSHLMSLFIAGLLQRVDYTCLQFLSHPRQLLFWSLYLYLSFASSRTSVLVESCRT